MKKRIYEHKNKILEGFTPRSPLGTNKYNIAKSEYYEKILTVEEKMGLLFRRKSKIPTFVGMCNVNINLYCWAL